MPIYEYNCSDCRTKFQKLRPMGKADAPVPCTDCGSNHTARAISLFSAISKGGNGETRAVSGTGSGCGSCTATSCANCNH
jgi:putative FmdB family regulatory protein